MRRHDPFAPLANFPEPYKEVLGGVAAELLEIDRLLKIAPLTTSQHINHDYGFRLMRRGVEILWVEMKGNGITAHYSRCTRRYRGFGWWGADIVNPEKFPEWMKTTRDHAIGYIIELLEQLLKRKEREIEPLRCEVSYQRFKERYDRDNPR